MRLDKYLAESWVGQRKQVRGMLREQRVSVNHQIVDDATYEIDETKDLVEFDGKKVIHPGKRYIMFDKPVGCITARKDDRHKTVLDYFKEEERAGLFPVGRLDKDTEGLLLLTNDGAFDYLLMNPTNHVEKTYYFWALGAISEEQKDTLERGISINDTGELTKPAKLVIDQVGFYDEFSSLIDGAEVCLERTKLGKEQFRKPVVSGTLTITEGKKHQVRRMLRAVGCFVISLKRISIGELSLDTRLSPGEYRSLTKEELELLHYQ